MSETIRPMRRRIAAGLAPRSRPPMPNGNTSQEVRDFLGYLWEGQEEANHRLSELRSQNERLQWLVESLAQKIDKLTEEVEKAREDLLAVKAGMTDKILEVDRKGDNRFIRQLIGALGLVLGVVGSVAYLMAPRVLGVG